MTRQQKEAALMEAISDKTPSLGCIVLARIGKYKHIHKYILYDDGFIFYSRTEYLPEILPYKTYRDVNIAKIIGHPVYLHNVLMWAMKNNMDTFMKGTYIFIVVDGLMSDPHEIPRDLSKDLYGQSDDTIDKLFELLPNNNN